MSTSYKQQHYVISISSPLGNDRLMLDAIDGEERISGLFHYSLEMLSEDLTLKFPSLVGKRMTVDFSLEGGAHRYLNGVIGKFVQGSTNARFTHYRAELFPWLWLLTLTKDCRIFQNQTVPQIIETVFRDAGYTDFRNALTAKYKPREYCVQYQESAFDFVSRLMEDEGIFYFFEHHRDRHLLVLADDRDSHPACPGIDVARYRGASNTRMQGDAITRCTFEQQVIPSGYAMDDFHFETPSTNLLVQANGKEAGRRIYEFPGGYTKTQEGESLANRRLEAYELPQTLLCGDSTCRSFKAGHRFTLRDHDRKDFDGTYVLSRLSIKASQNFYMNAFEAFPLHVPYRPLRQTTRPRIVGAQTAMVVGKSNEEIWTDKYGRVKVQFHWDQRGKHNEKSSCWVRVAQGWAGKQWGSLFIPRVGQEVVVSFLDGDPDRPLITGSVYNADALPPFPLPTHQTQSGIRTRSSKNGKPNECNEIRFEDKKGSEELFLQAQKDMNIQVNHNRKTIVDNKDLLVVKKGNRIVQVQKGHEAHGVKGKRKVRVEGDETHINKKHFTQQVKGNHVLKVKGNLTIDVSGSITIKAGKAIKNQAGTSLTNIAKTSLKNEAKISMVNKGGASQTVEGGGMLTVKGGVVKIN